MVRMLLVFVNKYNITLFIYLFILFIFNLFNVDNYSPFLTFGNKTSFPRRVTTTSNL